MYKLLKDKMSGVEYGAVRYDANGIYTSFPFDPANTDYQRFKQDIIDGAELQDADGNVMTQEQVAGFTGTLP